MTAELAPDTVLSGCRPPRRAEPLEPAQESADKEQHETNASSRTGTPNIRRGGRMSEAGARSSFDGHAEARRRAALLRTDPSHREWVTGVRSRLAKGGYVSKSERTNVTEQVRDNPLDA